MEIGLTLGITAAALVLFISNRIRADVVGLLVMSALIITGLVSPQEGISGFSNEATITVAAMFVLSAGLVRTGALDVIGKEVARAAGTSELRLMVVTITLVSFVSAFVNNTPVVVVMLPVLLGIARKINVAPSRILMPLSFSAQMGGTLTLIGSSTNLVVAGILVEMGLPSLGMFQFTLPALAVALVGAAYMLTIGRRLIPSREVSRDLAAGYHLRDYLSALVVEADSVIAGKTLAESRFAAQYGLQVVGIERGPERISSPNAATVIKAGDVLLVRGKIVDIAAIREAAHLAVATGQHDLNVGDATPGGGKLAELIVPPSSPIVGRSLRAVRFRSRYGVPVLGIQRHGQALEDHPRDVTIQAGDVLLVQASSEQLLQLHDDGDLALLGSVQIPEKRRRKMLLAVAIIVSVVLLSALDVLPTVTAALLGAIAMFLTSCVTPDEAYEQVDWMVIVMLGSLIPLGIAMQKTGTAEMLARGLLTVASPFGPVGILVAVYVMTMLITELISNTATALVVTPIAVATAEAAGISPLPLVIAVMFAATNAFATPIGYQTNTLIYGPGGYRFSDFVRVGAPLNILLLITSALVIPLFFPF